MPSTYFLILYKCFKSVAQSGGVDFSHAIWCFIRMYVLAVPVNLTEGLTKRQLYHGPLDGENNVEILLSIVFFNTIYTVAIYGFTLETD